MILDAYLRFSNAQAITVTATSTDSVDLGVGTTAQPAIPSFAAGGGARDIGIGDDPAMKLLVLVTTTFTAGGAATLTIALQGAVDNGSGAAAAFSTWWSSPAYAVAGLNAGSRLLDMDMPRPPDGIAIPRFLQLNYTVATGPMTAGALSAFIVLDRDDQSYQGTDNSVMGGYPAGITVAN